MKNGLRVASVCELCIVLFRESVTYYTPWLPIIKVRPAVDKHATSLNLEQLDHCTFFRSSPWTLRPTYPWDRGESGRQIQVSPNKMTTLFLIINRVWYKASKHKISIQSPQYFSRKASIIVLNGTYFGIHPQGYVCSSYAGVSWSVCATSILTGDTLPSYHGIQSGKDIWTSVNWKRDISHQDVRGVRN